ncbi:MAG: aminoacyl-tRNA hydrolase [Candidatus Paceibacterota bacterium]
MYLVVGLGNPGKKFKNTRHNIGFEVINKLAQEYNFPQSESLGKSLVSQGKIKGKEATLAKPQTYMNKSGQAVKELLNHFSLKLNDLIVIHDDLDLLTGELKISKDRGAGGHNGVQSVINQIETKDFVRIRMGIGYEQGTSDQKKYVLGKFNHNEKKSVEKMKKQATEATEVIIEQGVDQAMNEYN